MSRIIQGTLLRPDGTPLAGATIDFRAEMTTPDGVPRGVNAQVVTAADGSYSVEVMPGLYSVRLVVSTTTRLLGQGVVTSGSPITLPELLDALDVPPSVLQDILDRLTALEAGGGGGPVDWTDITGKPATFPPSAHTHVATDISDSTVTGRNVLTAANAAAARTAIGAEADGAATTAVSTHAALTSGVHGISAFGATLLDDANAAEARTTLGLGDSATRNIGTGAGTVAAGDDSRITGATPNSREIATTHSLTGGGDLTANRTLSLVGDTASPGANKVYGTDGSGNRGWKDDPSGGGGSPAGTNSEVQYRVDSSTFGAAPLRRADANTMEQHNGTNAQVHDWYRTRTDSSNWERVRLETSPATGWAQIALQSAGTGSANISLALTPLGNGALSAQVPDNTGAGGNARGQFATDWQRDRGGVAARVASGNYATIGGGQNNTASNSYSTVGGGGSNTASGSNSTVGGGGSNTASGSNSTVGGGLGNTASISNSTVGGGSNNTASGNFCVVAGGALNTASGENAWVPGGRSALTRGLYGAYAWASDRRAANGDAQRFGIPVHLTTTDATPTVLTANRGAPSSTNVLVLPNNSAWSGLVQVLARSTAGDVAKWTIDVLAKRGADAASTTISDSHVIRTFAEAGLSAASVSIVADTTRGAPTVEVTGVAGTTIDWWAEFFGGQVAR